MFFVFSSPEYKAGLERHCWSLENTPQHGSLKWFSYISDSGLLDFLMLMKHLKPGYIEDREGEAFLFVMFDRGHA